MKLLKSFFWVLFLIVFKIIRVKIFLLLLVILLLYSFQRNFIYIPTPPGLKGRQIEFNSRLFKNPKIWGFANFKDLYIQSHDNTLLNCWYISQNKDNYRKTILLFHGNSGNIGHRLDLIYNLYDYGFDVLVMDYRGFGNSEENGTSEKLYNEDSMTVFKHLKNEIGVPKENIYIFGRSLGGAVAINLAYRLQRQGLKIGGLIIENSFLNIENIAMQIISNINKTWWNSFFLLLMKKIVPFAIKDRWDSMKLISDIKFRALFIYGMEDALIDPKNTKSLYKLCGSEEKNKMIIGYEGCDHNNIMYTVPKRYFSDIRNFINGEE